MRQAPCGILHYSIYSSQASGRARASGTPDTRLHACRLVRDPPQWSTRPVRSSKEEYTAVVPAVWGAP